MMNNIQQQTHIKLYREVNNRIRYYFIDIYLNLFGSYILESKYGSIHNLKPTGIRTAYFETLSSAKKAMKSLIELKSKKGYKTDIKRKELK